MNLISAQVADELKDKYIEQNKSFAFETVMFSNKTPELLEKAVGNGMQVHTVYVTTRDPRINVERVKERVKDGGHNVDENAIIMRHSKSLGFLPVVMRHSTTCKIVDTSDGKGKGRELVFGPTHKEDYRRLKLGVFLADRGFECNLEDLDGMAEKDRRDKEAKIREAKEKEGKGSPSAPSQTTGALKEEKKEAKEKEKGKDGTTSKDLAEKSSLSSLKIPDKSAPSGEKTKSTDSLKKTSNDGQSSPPPPNATGGGAKGIGEE
ncbi:hypothetical protein FACS1894152_4330 [Bacilli bacterium]|nr:hypothetical protein FACS1894152_4330 [Bacilli bacterium]